MIAGGLPILLRWRVALPRWPFTAIIGLALSDLRRTRGFHLIGEPTSRPPSTSSTRSVAYLAATEAEVRGGFA
jgi:hypothetical protein